MTSPAIAVMPQGTPTIHPTMTRARNATALSTAKWMRSDRGGRGGRAPPGAGGVFGSDVTRWPAYCWSASTKHDQAQLGHLVDGVVRAFSRVAAVADPAVGHLVGAPRGHLVHEHTTET